MCFSASASFIASGVLIGASALSYKQASTTESKWLATIPFVFGVQQLAEGMIWLNLDKNLFPETFPFSRNFFLFIAWIVWPSYIPLIFRKFITNSRFRSLSTALLTGGITISIINSYTLFTQPIEVNIDGHHILYEWTSPLKLGFTISIIYVICTLVPPFLTENRKLYLLGAAHVIMFAVTYILMRDYLVSVWCFLAAISSGIIYWIIRSKAVGY